MLLSRELDSVVFKLGIATVVAVVVAFNNCKDGEVVRFTTLTLANIVNVVAFVEEFEIC